MKRIALLFLVGLWATVACVTLPSGQKAFIVTSESQEASLGQAAYQEVLQKEKVSQNSRWTQLLKQVGQRIARAANRPDYKWEFTLIESTQQNAFALPGGKVAFYTGILPVCQNEAGIATVMGHEVAHATLRHGGQRMTVAMGTQAGLITASMLLGGGGNDSKGLVLAALGLGANVGVMLPFSRSNESEADVEGLKYMARAGYDPNEAPQFWTRFSSKGAPPEFLSTHPSSASRSKKLAEQVPQVMNDYNRSPKYGAGQRI